jgi:LCP family protein required for cell wall assembly
VDEISYPYINKPPKTNFFKKVVISLFSILIIIGATYGSFLTYKIYAVGKKINIESSSAPSFFETAKSLTSAKSVDLSGYTDGRINILLLGIGGKGHPGQNLTDTIMLVSLNTQTNQVALYSIPRDMYVKIADSHSQAKINTIYQIGLASAENDVTIGADLIVNTIEDLTAQKINYYAILNFGGFEKIINTLGGINIINERDINDPTYPGPNYSYAPFKLEKGFHHLDGATALKYARMRHNDPEGDFGRAKRQQQVMQAAKNKIFSAGTFLNPIAVNSLFNALGENIITNVTPAEIVSFLELARKMDTQNINNVVLDAWNKDSLLKIVHINNFSALVPRVGNLSEIQELAQNVFDLNVIKRRRAEIEKESASIVLVNASGNVKIITAIKKLLSVNLNYKNVTIASAGKMLAEKTMAYDLKNGAKPFTLDELATKLPATVFYTAPPDIQKLVSSQKPDMILVIGKDLEERYNMEEGTLDDLNKSRDNQETEEFNENSL